MPQEPAFVAEPVRGKPGIPKAKPMSDEDVGGLNAVVLKELLNSTGLPEQLGHARRLLGGRFAVPRSQLAEEPAAVEAAVEVQATIEPAEHGLAAALQAELKAELETELKAELETRISFLAALVQQMEGQALRKQEETDARAKGLQGQVEALTQKTASADEDYTEAEPSRQRPESAYLLAVILMASPRPEHRLVDVFCGTLFLIFFTILQAILAFGYFDASSLESYLLNFPMYASGGGGLSEANFCSVWRRSNISPRYQP